MTLKKSPEPDKKAPSGAGLPDVCGRLKGCMDAMAKAIPASKPALDQSWKGIQAARGPGAKQVEIACKTALAALARNPQAPNACK